MKTITLSIDGMMCQHCVAHVTKALSAIEGVTPVVNLEKKNAVCTVAGDVPAEALESRSGRGRLYGYGCGVKRYAGR